MNLADTLEYAAWRQRWAWVFAPEHRLELPDTSRPLIDGFSVHSSYYRFQGEGFSHMASENHLLDCRGIQVYSWRNFHAVGDLTTLFRQPDGRRCLLFRQELYGYSVFCLDSRREIHYVPAQAKPGANFAETFLWTGAAYSPTAQLLAVDGCYWACPVSVVLVDFSEPLSVQPVEVWRDLRAALDPDDIYFDDIELVRWDPDGTLRLRASDCNTGHWETFSLPLHILRTILREGDSKRRYGGTKQYH